MKQIQLDLGITTFDHAPVYGASIDAIMYAWIFKHPANAAVVTGTMNIEREGGRVI